MNRLREFYDAEIVEAMTKKFSYTNKMAVPKLEKIVINMGVGEAKDNAKVLDGAVKDLTIISGQKPIITKAKKSVAAFKLRTGMPIGCKVTLRGDRMYEFAEQINSISLFPEFVTSAALRLTLSTAEETTQWVLRSSLSSLKSNMIRLTRSEVWISCSLQQQRQMKKQENY